MYSLLACQGDSGSPLQNTINGRTTVIGVASYVNSKTENGDSFKCAGGTAYSRISTYLDWIKSHLKEDFCS